MADILAAGAIEAKRALWRQEVRDFGGQLEWLVDPSAIPEEAAHFDEEELGDPYLSVAGWMLTRLVEWSDSVHTGLDFEKEFEKRELSIEQREEIRRQIQDFAVDSFWPGLEATAEVIATVPHVAAREGADRHIWADVASESRRMGVAIALNGTYSQAYVREYLQQRDALVAFGYDTSKLELDAEGGMTTVTPIHEVVDAAHQVAERLYPDFDHNLACVALQSGVSRNKKTMFDAVWDAFVYAAEHYIYPSQSIEPNQPAVAGYDEQLVQNIFEIASADRIAKWDFQ